jgi:hypothetical protein
MSNKEKNNMVKKFILGIALFGLVGILVGGAVLRTMDKTSQSSESHGSQGRGRSAQDANLNQDVRQGGGQRSGPDKDLSRETTGAGEASVEAWVTHEGAIAAVDEEMATIMLTDGEEIIIEGRSWSFAQEQGFAVHSGDQLELVGFYENNTFEVGQIDNLTTGQRVALRDETGRPLWAGRGRRDA